MYMKGVKSTSRRGRREERDREQRVAEIQQDNDNKEEPEGEEEDGEGKREGGRGREERGSKWIWGESGVEKEEWG